MAGIDRNNIPSEAARYIACLTKFNNKLVGMDGELLSYILMTWCNVDIDAAEMVASDASDVELDDDDASESASIVFYTPAGSTTSSNMSNAGDDYKERLRPLQDLADKFQRDVLSHDDDLTAKKAAILFVVAKGKWTWAQFLLVIRLLGWIEEVPSGWVEWMRSCTSCSCNEDDVEVADEEACNECSAFLYYSFM